MAVARTSAGAPVSGIAAISPVPGAGATAGDFGIIVCETADQTPGTPASWSASGGAAVGTPAGAAGATRATIFSRLAIAAADISPGPSVGDSGDHQIAAMLTYSGVDPVTPIISNTASGSGTAGTGVSTNTLNASDVRAGDVVLAFIATDRDSATASTNAAASWSGVTGTNSFPVNGSTSSASGGGIIVNELLVTADATGPVSFSCTITSSAWVCYLIVIKGAGKSLVLPNLNPMLPMLVR